MAAAAAADKPGRRARGQGGQRRSLFRRRKVCKFCADKIDDINYKDVRLLASFVPERGKMLPRRISGTCALHQRKLRLAITRARVSSRCCRMSRTGDRELTMEVILREHVDNLGRRGDVVKVAPGYARNFLMPRKLALPVNDGNKRLIERERKSPKCASSRSSRRKRWRAGCRRSSSACRDAWAIPSSCTARSPPPISPRRWPPRASRSTAGRIQLDEPLKALGEFTVPVKLHREVTAQLKVHVTKQDSTDTRRAHGNAPREGSSRSRRHEKIFVIAARTQSIRGNLSRTRSALPGALRAPLLDARSCRCSR